MMLCLPVVLALLSLDLSLAFSSHHKNSKCHGIFGAVRSSPRRSTSTSISVSGVDLLYQDQQAAMERRALKEEELLSIKKAKELLAPKIKIPPTKSGTGFGRSSSQKMMTPMESMAAEQAKTVHKEGVLRINNALSPNVADKLRAYVLDQQEHAEIATEKDVTLSRAFYGVENQRKNRCDLQLSLLKGGYLADHGGYNTGREDTEADADSHVLADALQELLGQDGTLRYLYENLVTLEGEFYELASVITDKGSIRQQVHPDLPFKDIAPLYVIFLALQDIDEHMGPTTFLLRTHTSKENDKFNDYSKKDEQLAKANCRLATLKKGDAVLFDARILHCGNANDAEKGSTRALFNFSFRNPKVVGSLGYDGSIRPAYARRMNLGDISNALVAYGDGDKDPFAKYSDGLTI